MARTVKTAEDRQDEILDTAARLIAERGYEKTSVQAIIDAVGIAKGTLYHHYSSKSDLLDAVVQRVADGIFAHVAPVVDDPDLAAPDKLVTYFRRIGEFKAAQAGFLVDLGRALELEANASVKRRLTEVSLGTSERFIATIIAQGIDEGAFDCRHPQHTARHLLAVFEASRAIWTNAMGPDGPDRYSRDDLLGLAASQQDAIERLLGAETGSIQMIDPEVVDRFLDAARTRK